jgi:dipeptidyl aminopeptidase/acylaminoacyl peptidase
MNMRHRGLIVALVSVLAPLPVVRAQGSRDDYERANKLPSLVRNKVFKSTVSPHWFAGNTRFWYRNDLADGAREFVLVDAVKGKRELAFDHARLAAALSRQLDKKYVAAHLPFTTLAPVGDGTVLRFDVAGKTWRWDRTTNELKEDKPTKARTDATELVALQRPKRGGKSDGTSPDGKWVGFIENNNVYVRPRAPGGEKVALSKEGTAADGYGGRIYWSPDSTKLVVFRTRGVEDRKVYLIESSPRNQLQPRLHTLRYPKPGDDRPISKPHLFDLASRKEIVIRDDLFPNPWSISQLRWEAGSGRFTFLYNQRGHQVVRLIAVEAGTGKATAIVDEQSKTFIDYAHKMFVHHLPATNELIWMSERDGWAHLYLYDTKTGKVKNQITRGNWLVRGVEHVSEKKREVWFRAGGIHPKQSPYHIHHARVKFDGTGLVVLTAGDGTHTIDYSPDDRFLLDTYSRVDLPPVTELRRVADGKLVCKLEEADVTALKKTGWRPPERFVCKGRDGKTDIWGIIHRPTNFDAEKKYPIVESIYAGPQGAFVPQGFSSWHRAQSMAELGFIVVQIDGMGTSHRSKPFHDVCWKNLGDSGFPDRILWIKAAAAKYPFMELSRVGVYGNSAGGQSALRALLAHGDFYKVAVSVCGCHDNRVDKIWWNELWMGWPIGPHYREQSNVTNAHKLTGKLFLIVGELDRNVDPASTMQVVDALVRANKDFDLLVVPGGGHGIGGAYGARRQRDFFVRHLLGVEPRHSGEK